MAHEPDLPEAWVTIPSEAERRAQIPAGASAGAYDYGFLPAMGRLLSVHKDIEPAFGACFRTGMFGAGNLSRPGHEMVSVVPAARHVSRL